MNIVFCDFGANVPVKERYERGVDYLQHEFDSNFDDAFYLIENLKYNRSSVIICTHSAVVNFYIFDNMLCVQIDADGFWHYSDLDLVTAKEILRLAADGCGDFGSQVPGTNLEWEARGTL